MSNYKNQTPGVYVEEVSTLPPSIAGVSTAIPAFIGATSMTSYNGIDLKNNPIRISSMLQYEQIFGGPANLENLSVNVDTIVNPAKVTLKVENNTVVDFTPNFYMWYALKMYFFNGGGPCYIVSIGAYGNNYNIAEFRIGLDSLKKIDEVTLVVAADGLNLGSELYNFHKDTLKFCSELGDRFAILDVLNEGELNSDLSDFRDGIGINDLKFGAAYYPNLSTSLSISYDEGEVNVEVLSSEGTETTTLAALKTSNNQVYNSIVNQINSTNVIMPPSSSIAGVYCNVDNTSGVWKAPANLSLNNVMKPTYQIDNSEQAEMNVTTTGKSVNAIRSFTGKGILVWGARTLDGNSNEWRYISVRRLFLYLEESIQKASESFVFQSNDIGTWVRIKGMIESFLYQNWKAGALAGAKSEQAYYVKIGLGETMTTDDILNGKMIVEIGVAAVRPAEFITLRFTHKLQEA